ncbi:MAG TPA: hypothetical protein VGN76_02165 [Gemmatimonadales bacterium]|jgi:uncharacterized repeat protein (TIGR01451 family)|nr:hypothetical protein [Gemmatimonadales bacterium]
MFSLLNRAGRIVVAVATLTFIAGRAAAQTPEGTVITNTATVTYTDANSNAYAPVSGSVSVTVGFTAGVSVTANTPSPTPASPSSANQLTFTVTNAGNGTDSVTISQNISVAGVISVTGYQIGATNYASLAALNLALSGTAITQGGTVQIKVNYDVAAGKGGVNTVYTLTAASRRTPATTANGQSSITPGQTYAVATTPDGGQNLQRLPGTNYSFTFTVQNNGNGSDQFDLLGTSPGSVVISIVSVNGVAGDSSRVTLGAGASQTYAVVYNVATVAAGSTDTLYLRARSVGQPATLNDGFADLTVVKPNLTITKQAFRDDGVTAVVGTVLPGEFIRYQVTVTNAGSTSATTVQVTDALPAELTYVSATGANWSFGVVGQNVTADYTATAGVLAAGASSSFVLRVSIN